MFFFLSSAKIIYEHLFFYNFSENTFQSARSCPNNQQKTQNNVFRSQFPKVVASSNKNNKLNGVKQQINFLNEYDRSMNSICVNSARQFQKYFCLRDDSHHFKCFQV